MYWRLRHRVDAWFSPANLLPVAMPRPMVVSILNSNVFASVVGTTERTPHTRRGCLVRRTSSGRSPDLVSRFARPLDRGPGDRAGSDRGRLSGSRSRPSRGAWRAPAWTADPIRPVRRSNRAAQKSRTPRRCVEVGVPSGLALVLVGPPGRGEAALSDAIAQSPAAPRIHHMGDSPRISGPRLCGCDLLRLSVTVGRPGFPPLEAMARGIPTAVANTSSLPEVTGTGAIRFNLVDLMRSRRPASADGGWGPSYPASQ